MEIRFSSSKLCAASEGNPAIQQHTTFETVIRHDSREQEHFCLKKEAIFLLLTGIGDEIYSTVDACKTANEMWIAIERLQQGESLNVQDVKTNLFWEFGKFTSRDGESMESYYYRTSAASTRHKGKEIAKPVTPQSESVSEKTVILNKRRGMDMAKEFGTTCKVQNNDENNVFANERQHSENNTAECADERAALANLIANLTLDTDENNTILKQLKKANASLTQELEECKTNLDETSRALREAIVIGD
ncbi:hypothetical protein Tco_0364405 [Tanacetum coccineum]